MPDPYDWRRNAEYRPPDASLYNGTYYMYWGPVPALFHAAWKGATGWWPGTAPMQTIVAFGTCLWFRLLRRLRDLARPGTPDFLVNSVYLCFAVGGVGLFLVVRSQVHHEAIVWAGFFLVAGLYWWLRGLEGGARIEGGRAIPRRVARLFLNSASTGDAEHSFHRSRFRSLSILWTRVCSGPAAAGCIEGSDSISSMRPARSSLCSLRAATNTSVTS
jgi:hypothetical protein